jgi:2-polyprenyl-3-methyl-5-hydroxy-6-metoxy-1,4-benzoquinol methylase
MKRLYIEDTWPDSWKYSYPYDLLEIWGEVSHRGFAYAYANRRSQTLALIREVLPSGSTILDVAAAQGNFSLTLAEEGYQVTWNDLREDLAGYVQSKYETGTITYAPGNVFELNFEEKFDCVLITEIIEHVAHPDQFLKKISVMVKKGGFVVMSTPNGGYFRNNLPRFLECPDPAQYEKMQFKPNSDGHIFLLWPDEIEWLAKESGLTLDRHILFTNPLTAGHIKLEGILKLLPRSIPERMEVLSQKLGDRIKTRLMANSASRFRKV